MTSQGIYYLIRALVALVAIPFHECGHALAAWLLGLGEEAAALWAAHRPGRPKK